MIASENNYLRMSINIDQDLAFARLTLRDSLQRESGMATSGDVVN
jgi:hypothetical protein